VKANRTAASNSRASPSASKSFFLPAFHNARLAILRIFVAEIRQGDSLAILRLGRTLTASLCNIDHWSGFQSYGSISVSTPMTRPTQSFARRWRKNDPWPQSCWIMKRPTRKPAAALTSEIRRRDARSDDADRPTSANPQLFGMSARSPIAAKCSIARASTTAALSGQRVLSSPQLRHRYAVQAR